MTLAEPTPEMIAFYEKRTREHIARVAANLQRMSSATEFREELLERAETHDASKFSPAERIPYVWLSEFHRCRREGTPFEYPPGVEAAVRAAIDHHVTSNRHHYQFHNDPNEMTRVDLIEMVCDWTAMAQEHGEDGGSARSWADKTVGVRIPFNRANRDFIYEMIDLLDRQIAADRNGGSQPPE